MADTFMVVELSTGHLTEDVAKEMDRIVDQRRAGGWQDPDAWQYWIVAERWSTYGWWMWAENEDGFDELPTCIQDCMRFARDKGCRWVLFDADVAPVEDLKVYDW